MTLIDPHKESLIRRMLDAFDSVGSLLEEVNLDVWDLYEYLIDGGYVTEDTLPFLFNDVEELEDDRS